jgi:hypothetical protein
MAGNFSYRNMEPSNGCAGTAPTDGEGINLDTFDFSQGGGPAYVQQSVVENNIVVANGGRGVEVENNSHGAGGAPIIIRNNTTYGDNATPIGAYCQGNGEIGLVSAYKVQVTNNLSQTAAATGCSGYTIYGLEVSQSNNTTVVNDNWALGENGNNTFMWSSGSFAFGTNTIGINPAFYSTAIPGAPSCSGTTNVPACMATLILNFTPTNTSARAYGYQMVTSTSSSNSLFPQWLCNVNLPSGLVTTGCFRLHLAATVS